MSHGSASWMLKYPPERFRKGQKGEWTGKTTYGEGVSHWRKFIRLCQQLHRTGVLYSVEYIDMGGHCRALVEWSTP